MGKVLGKIALWILIVLVVLVLLLGALFFNELRTLATLKQVDDYGFFTMTYAGDYGFDEFLKVGAQNDRDIEKFVMKRLLKGAEIDLHIADAGCTAFRAANEAGETVFGRNFDFDYAPSLLVKTKPKNGYASMSMVNLAFAGYGKGDLPSVLGTNSFLTLAAPYLPFDGVNEKGVAMALLAVPKAEPPTGGNRVTLNTTTAIRLVLDKAATVDEALALLRQYNYYFSGDVQCHYLLADASGRSVVVEFMDGALQVIEPQDNYQVVTNFILYHDLKLGEGYSEFERYDIADKALRAGGGVTSEQDAMKTLSAAQIPGDTQWSEVYNLANRTVDVAIGGQFEKLYSYSLK